VFRFGEGATKDAKTSSLNPVELFASVPLTADHAEKEAYFENQPFFSGLLERFRINCSLDLCFPLSSSGGEGGERRPHFF
jgi:hypothetical protein